jgi:hypothetical protein
VFSAGGVGGVEKEARSFFFGRKRSKKTFIYWRVVRPESPTQIGKKFFASFFQKKKGFALSDATAAQGDDGAEA